MKRNIKEKGVSFQNFATLIGLIVFSAMLVSCGSSGNKSTETKTSKPKGKLNACSVLTADMASDILHEKVTKIDAYPRNMELQGGKVQNSICSYDAVSSDRTLGLNLTYAPINRGKHPTLEKFKKSASAKEVGEPEEVKGVGDFAIWNIAYGAGILYVYAGDYKAVITIRSMSKGAAQSDMELAKKTAMKILKAL